MTASFKHLWSLDPDITFLNHGSFGACPADVLGHYFEIIRTLEAEPVRFMVRDLAQLQLAAREALARFLGADPDGIAFLPNATTGVNTALRAVNWRAGDEIVVTDHGYNACNNAVAKLVDDFGVVVKIAKLPFENLTWKGAYDAILEQVGARTRLVLMDHVTSPTGLVLPVKEVVSACREQGVLTIVDGAHAPGMLPLDLDAIGATFYAGNCHKWMCSPKTAAFLSVDSTQRLETRPLVIGHGANRNRGGLDRFRQEFDWMGTTNPAAMLTLPYLIDYMDGLVDGGWDSVRATNHALVLEGRDLVCTALGVEAPCPESMVGSLAAIPIRETTHWEAKADAAIHPLQERLFADYAIEVPVYAWDERLLIRLSAQLYNERTDYQKLADALVDLLA